MSYERQTSDANAVFGVRRRRPVLECHECEVICERVVSPWRCLQSRQTCIYAFEEGETTYFGCVHKVFAPEFDLSAFSGQGDGGGRKGDPYGPVRVMRTPRPQCPVSVERAYRFDGPAGCCINPGFLRDVFEVRGSEELRGIAIDAVDDDLVNG